MPARLTFRKKNEAEEQSPAGWWAEIDGGGRSPVPRPGVCYLLVASDGLAAGDAMLPESFFLCP